MKKNMKYIKLYESKDITKEDIMHCFADLGDMGLTLTFTLFGGLKIGYVGKYKTFKYKDIEEVMIFALSYLSQEYGINFTRINYRYTLNKGWSSHDESNILRGSIEDRLSIIRSALINRNMDIFYLVIHFEI